MQSECPSSSGGGAGEAGVIGREGISASACAGRGGIYEAAITVEGLLWKGAFVPSVYCG